MPIWTVVSVQPRATEGGIDEKVLEGGPEVLPPELEPWSTADIVSSASNAYTLLFSVATMAMFFVTGPIFTSETMRGCA